MEEALSADFSFSGEAQRMERKAEKGTAFAHPVLMCFVGAPDLGSAGIPAVAQPRAGHFPHDAAKTLPQPIPRRKQEPCWQQAMLESWVKAPGKFIST